MEILELLKREIVQVIQCDEGEVSDSDLIYEGLGLEFEEFSKIANNIESELDIVLSDDLIFELHHVSVSEAAREIKLVYEATR